MGRCYKGVSTDKRDRLNAMMAVNHACYAAANAFELVLDTTNCTDLDTPLTLFMLVVGGDGGWVVMVGGW